MSWHLALAWNDEQLAKEGDWKLKEGKILEWAERGLRVEVTEKASKLQGLPRWLEALHEFGRIGASAGVDGAWLTTCGIDGGGALLVRPDQHIVWRSPAGEGTGADLLADAVASVAHLLGR